MRTVRALALAAMLTVSTGTMAFAGEGSGYAQPARPGHDVVLGEGSGYTRPVQPGGDAVRNSGEGSGYTTPVAPADGIRNGELWA